jgi:hypothetical protein
MPALPPKKPATTSSPTSEEWTDSHGITYLHGEASVRVAVDVKLSRNYQSCGVQAGMEFKTRPEKIEEAIKNGYAKLRDSLKPVIAEASSMLDEL